jgi:hypothetical protein
MGTRNKPEPFPKTSTVVGLVRRVLSDWSVAPILADALEEAGYSETSILHNLRSDDKPPTRYNTVYDLLQDSLPIPKELEGSDWMYAFAYAGEPNQGRCDGTLSIKRADPRDRSTSLTPFSRWDVAEVLGLSEGENDGKNWLVYGRLLDGRYFFLSAGCDYTGWG